MTHEPVAEIVRFNGFTGVRTPLNNRNKTKPHHPNGRAWLQPGLNADLANQPCFVVRPVR